MAITNHYLEQLENEAIYILRETAAQFEKPALLFSGGKDSIVLVHLALKAFRPGKFPFPLVHIDTGHNFPEAIEFRDYLANKIGEKLIVASVEDSIKKYNLQETAGRFPSRNALQTYALLDAIEENQFDACIGGARRDEEKARAKERIFSVRDDFGQWDPKLQRPELWDILNGKVQKGHNVRVFPISNWTELDVWNYIQKYNIELPSLYFAHDRECIVHQDKLVATSKFIQPIENDTVVVEKVRYRTVGDMTCTAAVPSEAATIQDIIDDIIQTRISERGQTRLDDQLSEAAMEDRKNKDIFKLETKKHMNTLRFITAGNVDDGKSTLIGRLLYDSDSIHTDQLGVLQKQTKQEGVAIDLSLITDGLRAEREQGITIDVAYKYFSTKKRKFIIADAPGHEQYTRNMITGASNSDLIIILVDARKGITEQTKRHASIGSLMGLKKVIIAVNKIDLLNYSEAVFNQIKADFEAIKSELNYNEISYIPVSALVGDNIVTKSENTSWYQGKALLETLEDIEVETTLNLESRFQAQWVIRPKDEVNHDYRGYAGLVLSGSYKVGDEITILPARITTKIVKIENNLETIDVAKAGDNVVLHFENNIDVSRGDTIVLSNQLPTEANQINTWISWLDNAQLQLGKTYLLQHRFKNVRVKVQSINQKWNINEWQFTPTEEIKLNDIAQITLKTNQPLFFDPFDKNAKSGNAILIDETTFNTVGALMFLEN